MQTADPAGAMAAVIGLDAYAVARALIGTHVVVANDNAPGQVVVSGPRAELARAADDLKKIGAKRVIPLRVSAAFHSPAMQNAAPRLREAIDVTPFGALRHRLIAQLNSRDFTQRTTAMMRLVHIGEPARDALEEALRSPAAEVRLRAWRALAQIGPGAVLTGLVKRILPDITTWNVSDESTLRQSLPLLKGDAR